MQVWFLFSAVKVTPRSIKHADPKNPSCKNDSQPLEIPYSDLSSDLEITYSYSVRFEVSLIFVLHGLR